MSEDADVVVVGAGFAGLATARACLDAGLRVVVLERREELGAEGAGITIQPVGLAALARIGRLGAALELTEPFTRVEQCDARGRVRARFDYATLEHPHPFLMAVERARLVGVLAEGVEVRFGTAVEGLVQEDGGASAAGVRWRRGTEQGVVRARWVVGADGRGSAVRGAAGIRSWLRTRAERYVVGLVPGEPIRDVGRLYCGPGWADGVLPHPDRLYFFDFVDAANRAAVDARDFEAWAAAYARRIPDAPAILERVASFDDLSVLAARVHVALPRVRGRVVLAGDAAASVHPHTGQGANFALEDGSRLGAALASGDDGAVRAYGRARDRVAARFVPYSVLAGRSLDAGSAPWRAVRSAGMTLARFPPAGRRMLRQQVGLA